MKEIISDAEFRKRIEKNAIGGYLLFGDEDYLKAHAIKWAREQGCPDPSMAVFNDMSVDATASEDVADALVRAISAAPMMAETKVITLTGLAVGSLKSEDVDALLAAVGMLKEFDFNLLIISVPSGMLDEGRLPKNPSPLLSKLGEQLTPVRYPRVDSKKLCSWMVRHFEHNGVRAESGVAAAIIECCGSDMFTLANEVDKLSFYARSCGRDTVTLSDVPLVVSPNEEYDAFALGEAVADKRFERALSILSLMKARRIDPLIILGELSKTLSDMLGVKLLLEKKLSAEDIRKALKFKSEYRVTVISQSVKNISAEELREAVAKCSAADTALKSFTVSAGRSAQADYMEIEKLICSL